MSEAADAEAPALARKTVAQMLGEIVWLMTQSPGHKQLFIGDLEWFCVPPILLEQFRIFYGPSAPAAVAIWASVSDECHSRLMEGGQRLKPNEWKSGANLWLMELVAPFGGQDEVLADLSASVFAGKPFHFHRVDATGNTEVRTYPNEPRSANHEGVGSTGEGG